MTLDDVADSELLGHRFLVSKLEELLEARLAALEDEVRAGVDVGSVPDGAPKDFDVVVCDAVGVGEDLTYTFGDSDLWKPKVRMERY